jgi:phenylacetate-coenzyme A ligase PaaK-like adenylate-forming protein
MLDIHSYDLSHINKENFEQYALDVFEYQYLHNSLYRDFCTFLKRSPSSVKEFKEIPFLPISFFKTHQVCDDSKTSFYFESSGTTGQVRSKHFVRNLKLYEQSFLTQFEKQYGPIENLCIISVLPSYHEQKSSSLLYMINTLIAHSKYHFSGFYKDNYSRVIDIIEKSERPVILFGVAYALMDMSEAFPTALKNTIIIETGGMKGKRKEIIREELHQLLRERFALDFIDSEYGMTELLSQAYMKDGKTFQPPNWMRVLTRSIDDPFEFVNGKTGGINIIDLANLHSCAFIATQDLGKLHTDLSFEVLGRFDASDVRGCNQLIS